MKHLVVDICGHRWSIYKVSPHSKHLYDKDYHLAGFCDYTTRRIFIANDQSEEDFEDTLLHELFHAVLFETRAERVYNCCPKKDEKLVGKVTPVFHRLLKDLGFRFPRIH